MAPPEEARFIQFAVAPAGWGELEFTEFDEFGGRLHYQVVRNVLGRKDASRVWMTSTLPSKAFAVESRSASFRQGTFGQRVLRCWRVSK